MLNNIVKPILKWAGGKTQMLGDLLPKVPKSYGRYIEPFFGGGAMFFALQPENAIIADSNPELINMYRQVAENVDEVISCLKKYENSSEMFYAVREQDWMCLSKSEAAARTIFLNRTCFNGLYRVNKDGKFNVPHGKYKNPLICDKENLKLCSKLLQKVEISFGNYEQVLGNADKNTFVYFDPPYRPLVENNSFVSYDKSGFDDNDQIKLADNYKILNNKNCLLMLSNSDPKNTNKEDNFFDDIYDGFEIKRVFAKRMINCQASKRGDITEIVVMNYKRRK